MRLLPLHLSISSPLEAGNGRLQPGPRSGMAYEPHASMRDSTWCGGRPQRAGRLETTPCHLRRDGLCKAQTTAGRHGIKRGPVPHLAASGISVGAKGNNMGVCVFLVWAEQVLFSRLSAAHPHGFA